MKSNTLSPSTSVTSSLPLPIKKGKGRPTKFDEHKIQEIIDLVKDGKTNKETGEAIGVDEVTLRRWRNKYPDFSRALKKAKIKADGEVIASLNKRAKGFTGPDGKYYPPDPTSCIFWLKNRNQQEWRDQQDHKLSGTVCHEYRELNDEDLIKQCRARGLNIPARVARRTESEN